MTTQIVISFIVHAVSGMTLWLFNLYGSVMQFKARKQHLLTLQVNRYCILAFARRDINYCFSIVYQLQCDACISAICIVREYKRLSGIYW